MGSKLSRRALMTGIGGVGITTVLAGDQDPVAETESPPADCHEALERLKSGNQRFVKGETRHSHQASTWRKHLVGGQQPIATILGCSDSRVPPELVFDQGFGDLFVIRVAGNIIDPAVFGSIGYAVVHLKTRVFFVLGHQKCGAVTASLDGLFRKGQESRGIEGLLKYVKPALQTIDPNMPVERQVEVGVEANVRYVMKQLAETPEGAKAIKEKRLLIAGGVYELETGAVRFLGGE